MEFTQTNLQSHNSVSVGKFLSKLTNVLYEMFNPSSSIPITACLLITPSIPPMIEVLYLPTKYSGLTSKLT